MITLELPKLDLNSLNGLTVPALSVTESRSSDLGQGNTGQGMPLDETINLSECCGFTCGASCGSTSK